MSNKVEGFESKCGGAECQVNCCSCQVCFQRAEKELAYCKNLYSSLLDENAAIKKELEELKASIESKKKEIKDWIVYAKMYEKTKLDEATCVGLQKALEILKREVK